MKKYKTSNEQKKPEKNIISGKNAIITRLESGDSINQIWLSDGLRRDPKLQKLMDLASNQNVKYIFADRRKLDELSDGINHQGVVADIPPFNYAQWETLKGAINIKSTPSLILVLDSLEDPHNVGAIIRTAVAAGVNAVILAKHRAVQITDAVVRASAGNAVNIPIVRVTNISNFIREIKEEGFWIYGLAGEGKINYSSLNYPDKVVVVTGNEGKGLSSLVKKLCDELVSIPMKNSVESLNASVSTALMLYKVQENRKIFT